jgi:hypothetical protein
MKLHDVDAFGGLDWGFNSPGCMLWFLALPDGHFHVISEYRFQQQSAEEVAGRIQQVTKGLGIRRLRYIACDPSMKAKTGPGRGESIMETLQRRGLPMRPSDNSRVLGWMRVHELLQPAPDGRPWLTVEPTCRYLIKTMSAAIADSKNPDDVDTDIDDHALDALRYGAMSRPSPTRHVVQTAFRPHSAGALLNDALAAARNRFSTGLSYGR